jgi:hypothetical protein
LLPNEVIALLRQHALELIEFHDKMSAFKDLSANEALVVLNLCLYLIEELAENRWLTSDVIEKYESGDPPVFVFNKNKLISSDSLEVENPPFEADYFLNHPDL